MIPGRVAGSGIVAPEGAAEGVVPSPLPPRSTTRPIATAASTTPATSVTVRLRLRADCLRWISSRSIRACSLRSAFVSRWSSPEPIDTLRAPCRSDVTGYRNPPLRLVARPRPPPYARRAFPSGRRWSRAGHEEGGGAVAQTSEGQTVRVPDAPKPGGLDGFFKITERGSTMRIEIFAGHHDLADDGLHPVPEPRHPRRDPGQHRHHARVPAGAHGDGARRRRHDDRDGRRRASTRSRSPPASGSTRSSRSRSSGSSG